MRQLIAPGTEISWASQSQGTFKRKTGIVVAFVPARQDPRDIWPDATHAKPSHIKFDLRPSCNDRYIVAVPRPGSKSGIVDYYAPPANWFRR